MKRKAFAALMAGALAMSAVMPAAAAEGGSIDVTVGTKTGVIRVVVPTTMEVAVDQFEKGAAGTQIHSDGFSIENKSDIAVKVSVTSEATLSDKVGVLSSRADVEDSASKDGELWLAAAALVADGKYENASGADDLSKLDETKDNVAVFAAGTSGKASASQVFYLDKGTGSVTYTLLKPAEAGKTTITYAQFYKLTSLTDEPAYDAAHAAGDVYYVATASADDGAAVTKIEKGDTHTYDGSTNTYYTAATTVTEVKDLVVTDSYVYASMATAGSSAGFRYIGELSSVKETWSANDFSNVKITYTIDGVTQSRYTDVSGDLKNGLLPSKAPSIATMEYTLTAGTAVDITVDLGKGDLVASGVAKVTADETADYDYIEGGFVTYDADAKKLTLKADMVDACISASISNLNVIFDDDAETTVVVTLE